LSGEVLVSLQKHVRSMVVLDPRQVRNNAVRWQQIAPRLLAQHTGVAS